MINNFTKKNIYLKRNLNQKKDLCNQAKDLLQKKNLNGVYKSLQQLHSDWKGIGPTERKYKKKIWQEFQEITKKIHKKRVSYLKKVKANEKTLIYAKKIQNLVNPVDKIRDKQQNRKDKSVLKNKIVQTKQNIRRYEGNLGFLANNKETVYLRKEIEQKIKKNLRYILSLEKKLTTLNKR